MQTRRALVKQLFAKMSLRQKCEALAVNRSSMYYQATERPEDEVDIMNMIREISFSGISPDYCVIETRLWY